MKRALETLLQDLKDQLEAIGVQPLNNEKIELAVTDPEMLKHAQLHYYDSKNCDGFQEFSDEDRSAIAKTMIDANQHEFARNVGIALWNTTLDALYMLENPKSSFNDDTLKTSMENQYLYMDNQRIEKDDKKGGRKLISPSHTPTIVDLRTLGFAKSYQQFLGTMLADPDPLLDVKKNIGSLAMKLLGTKFIAFETIAIQKFQATHDELKARIAFFEARQQYNAQTPEERQKEFQRLESYEKKVTEKATAASERFQTHFQIRATIKDANKDVTKSTKDSSYTPKIAAVKDQIDQVEKLIESFPTTDLLQQIAYELIEEKSKQPSEPIFRLTKDYLSHIAKDLESHGSYNIQTVVDRVDINIAKTFDLSIGVLKLYTEEAEDELEKLKSTKSQLESLALALEELNRLSLLIEEANKILASEVNYNLDTASADDLQSAQSQLRKSQSEIKLVLDKLNTINFENAQIQNAFETGLNNAELTAITQKLREQDKKCQLQLDELTSFMRKRQLEKAQGNLESLIELKRNAESSLSIYNNSFINTSNDIKRLRSISNIAESEIRTIEHKYSDEISRTKALIEKRENIASGREIQSEGKVVNTVVALATFKKQLVDAAALFEKSGIPVSNEQFDDLKHLLDWDEATCEQWSYIKNQSYFSMLKRGAIRAASTTNIANTPEMPLQEALNARLAAVKASLSASRLLDQSRAHLDRLQADQENERRPYLYRKSDATRQIDAALTELKLVENEREIQKENSKAASECFEKLLETCLNKLKMVELRREAIQEVKQELKDLTKKAGSTFHYQRMRPYLEFNRLYLIKEKELAKQEEKSRTQAESAAMKPTREVVSKKVTIRKLEETNAQYHATKIIPAMIPFNDDASTNKKEKAAAQRQTVAREPAMIAVNSGVSTHSSQNHLALDNAAKNLYHKYFRIDNNQPENDGLATQYLAKRAAAYKTFDKFDAAFTQGLKFFSCGNSKAKTDQESRIDYLGKVASALSNYSQTNKIAYLKGAYNLVAGVLNNPNRFPSRAAEGSEAYKDSMRALLTTLMTDLQNHPELGPMIRKADEEARNQVQNPVYWRP